MPVFQAFWGIINLFLTICYHIVITPKKGEAIVAVHRAMRSCRLADDLYLKAKYIATTEKRSFNNWLEIILQKEIAAYEKENGPILVQTDDLYQ